MSNIFGFTYIYGYARKRIGPFARGEPFVQRYGILWELQPIPFRKPSTPEEVEVMRNYNRERIEQQREIKKLERTLKSQTGYHAITLWGSEEDTLGYLFYHPWFFN